MCGLDFIAQKSLLPWVLECLITYNLAKERDLPLPEEPTSEICNCPCGLRAKGECSEGSSDLCWIPELMQPYQFQLLLLLLI